MKKYYYNLYGKNNSYTLSEIANALEIDNSLLEELLDESNQDIDLACLKGLKEVTSKAKLRNLAKLYDYNYLCIKPLNEIMRDELDIRNNKRKLLNSFNYLFKQNNNGYISLDKDSINTLLVNTEDDINKKTMSNNQCCAFKSLNNFIDTNDKYFFKLVLENIDEVYFNNVNNNTYDISINDLKKLVDYLSTSKLPLIYNSKITAELSKKMSNNNSCCKNKYKMK